MLIDFKRKQRDLEMLSTTSRYGIVSSIKGVQIISNGPNVSIGDLCEIHSDGQKIDCEVIGFENNNKFLMPFKPVYNIKSGDKIYKSPNDLDIKISDDYLGCVLNGIGEIIDDNGVSDKRKDIVSFYNEAPMPTSRTKIDTIFETGVKAIDGLLTIGVGQRIGLFAGSGVGKSTLLGNIVKNSKADVKVICLIGERGRELNDFLELLGDGRKDSIVVTATGNESSLLILKSAYTATRISEYFRDQGKNVLLVMDSLTRFAIAQRDIATSRGELPVNKGYPPSALKSLGELLERAGKNDKGSITGIYTVLVEGDDDDEIITDTARGILDGHIFLSKKIAAKKRFPAIDVLKSVSRLMNNIADDRHLDSANNLNAILAYCEEKEGFLNMSYKRGSDPNIDRILDYRDIILNFLKQKSNENMPLSATQKFLIDNFEKINVRI